MKREQRAVYLELSKVSLPPRSDGELWGIGLCTLCKFSTWQGSCNDAWPECLHPLAGRIDALAENAAWEPGVDCFAFRPHFSVDTIAELIGQRLAGRSVAMPAHDPCWEKYRDSDLRHYVCERDAGHEGQHAGAQVPIGMSW